MFKIPVSNLYHFWKQSRANNFRKWPPLFMGWCFICVHLSLAVALWQNENVQVLFVFAGLERSIEYLGRDATIITLVFISFLAAIAILFEYSFSWPVVLGLILPQYLIIASGGASDLYILITGEYAEIERNRWLIIAGLALFFWMAVWHTVSVVWRVQYWIQVSSFRRQVLLEALSQSSSPPGQ